jgi:hypothetical protein
MDLSRSGGHPRVWRQSLQKESPYADEYWEPDTEEFKAEGVQLSRSSPERLICRLAYKLGILLCMANLSRCVTS